MRYRNKKLVILYLLASTVIMGILPSLNFGLNKTKSHDIKSLYSTDMLEAYKNLIAFKYFKLSANPGLVVAGKEDFLFLGNKHDNIIKKINGEFRPSAERIESWVDRLLNLQAEYEKRNIKFLIVIAPEKQSIYPEHLPNRIHKASPYITDDIVSFAKEKQLNLLDLRPKLIKEKENALVYWVTDSHWNQKGAAIAFDEIIEHLNNTSELKITKPKYNLIKYYTGGGDLTTLLKINTLLPKNIEESHSFSFQKNYQICKGDINKQSGAPGPCNPAANPIIGVHSGPQFTVNQAPANQLNLLLLCDSYCTSHSQLFNASFKTVWRWHWSHINAPLLSRFLAENTPDLVIYQIAERVFYGTDMATHIP